MTAAATPELLAPAGNRAALEAALEAGADAVYFGLQTLNARRGAENFRHEELGEIVDAVHAAGARAHLTLNIALGGRETGQAARMLELARRCGVDAVLAADPALLRLRPSFPELAFHGSTQAGVSNSAGVAAAAALGLERVVLARELTLGEIRAAAGQEAGLGVEVFVQGALCFSASGRCLLSSWGGGRSGNRGACASPCRVAWRADGAGAQRLFSLHDLCLIDRLDELAEAGVAALKIEGRLKGADWVRRAVTAYRRVLDGAEPAEVRELVLTLGDYTGRRLTHGFLDGGAPDLVGDAARPSTAADEADAGEEEGEADEAAGYTLRALTASGRLACTVRAEGEEEAWEMPLSEVKKVSRALTLADLGTWLEMQTIQGRPLARFETDAPGQLIPRSTANKIADRISAALHRVRRRPDTTVRLDLPQEVREALRSGAVEPANDRPLGAEPNAARLPAGAAEDFARQTEADLILVDASVRQVRRWAERLGAGRLCAALPAIWYAGERRALADLVAAAAAADVPLEVNDWGGWHLVREAGARWRAGPGLGVLNPLAARALADRGAEAVSLSLEADRQQMEDFSKKAPVPWTLTVYGRPVLAATRAATQPPVAPGAEIEDNRGIRVRVEADRGLTLLRAAEPFDLSDLRNRRIQARWLAADFVGAADPVGEWYELRQPGKRKNRFNYSRGLY